MGERERAHHYVDFVVADGQFAQVTLEQAGVGNTRPGQIEHLGGAVDPDHVVAPSHATGEARRARVRIRARPEPAEGREPR